MTAQQGSSAALNKRKKPRADQTTHNSSSVSQTSSSQRLEDLAAQNPSSTDDALRQSYRLRSSTLDTSTEALSGKQQPYFMSCSFSPAGMMKTPNGMNRAKALNGRSNGVPVITTVEGGIDPRLGTTGSSSPTCRNQVTTSGSGLKEAVNTAPASPSPPSNTTVIDPPKSPPPPGQDVIKLSDVMARLDSLSGLGEKMDSMAEDIRQLRCLGETTSKLCQDVLEVKENVGEMQTSVSALEAKQEENELNQQAIAKELIDLKAIVHELQAQQASAEKPVTQAESDFEFLKVKAALRENNLIFEGIREPRSDRDGSARRQVQAFCRNTLGISHAEIDKAYRLGKPRKESAAPRPIFVRFTRLGDRDDVWRARSVLNIPANSHFFIKEDLPMPLRPTMAALLRVCQTARRFPQKYQVFIRDYKVYVNGEAFEAKDLEQLPKDLRPSFASTPGNVKTVVFFGKDSRFSNHYVSRFVVDDIEFHSIEQFLAHSRARFADDQNLMDKALASSEPTDAKKILNLLRDAQGQPEWEEERHDILLAGLLAKFRQSDDLKTYLLSSGDRQLGEASKNRIWGIGMTLADKERLNTRYWKGYNLLGKTLMEVRKILAPKAVGEATQSGPETTNGEPEPTLPGHGQPNTDEVTEVPGQGQPSTAETTEAPDQGQPSSAETTKETQSPAQELSGGEEE